MKNYYVLLVSIGFIRHYMRPQVFVILFLSKSQVCHWPHGHILLDIVNLVFIIENLVQWFGFGALNLVIFFWINWTFLQVADNCTLSLIPRHNLHFLIVHWAHQLVVVLYDLINLVQFWARPTFFFTSKSKVLLNKNSKNISKLDILNRRRDRVIITKRTHPSLGCKLYQKIDHRICFSKNPIKQARRKRLCKKLNIPTKTWNRPQTLHNITIQNIKTNFCIPSTVICLKSSSLTIWSAHRIAFASTTTGSFGE